MSVTASRAAGAFLTALGVLVILGWIFEVRRVTSVFPGLATMKPNTALCFALLGLAIWLSAPSGRWRGRTAQALGVVVAMIGAITSLEYRTGLDAGVDELFLSVGDPEPPGPYPARMSEMTAIAFLLGGLGVAGIPYERLRHWVHALALAVAVISATALVGYTYGVEGLYAVNPFSSVALHSAVGFSVAAIGMLWARPEQGIAAVLRSESIGGVTARWIVPFAIAVPFVLGWLALAGARRGLYNLEFETALLTVTSMTLFAGLALGYAGWLDHAEVRRVELERQLFQSQKMEAVARLAGGIAHDFNNVLSVILTSAELAHEDASDEGVRGDLGAIRDAAGRASALTKQLLALGRRQVMHPKVVDINDVLRRNEILLRRMVPEHVTCTFRLAEDLGPIRMDPSKLEQIILNLVVNAVDAMPDGGRLNIETRNAQLDRTYTEQHAEVEPGPYVSLTVADTGIGMDPSTASQAFEPFFTTKEPGKGTGLGLSTLYGIVRQSRGHIWLYSEERHGTTFKVYLPLHDEQGVAPSEEAVRAPSRGGTETVLVVDDDALVAQAATKVLTRGGYTVHSAASGLEALRILESRRGQIDLLLTDVMMPTIGARELTERLGPGSDVRILYMSGYADDTALIEDMLEGGRRLVEKPFTPAALLDAVREALDG